MRQRPLSQPLRLKKSQLKVLQLQIQRAQESVRPLALALGLALQKAQESVLPLAPLKALGLE